MAETEKYAHVTFFFNSQVENPVDGEDRIMVPSPKVPSYDLQPEMSAEEVSNKVIEKFTGINLYNQDSKALINYPILKILPINNPYYRVMACNSKHFPNDSEKIAICVIMDDLGYKNDLKNEIINRGYNLDSYEVIWN